MSFSRMLELLKKKEKGKIVLVKLGNFYIATEEDAVILHKKLQLQCSCFKNNTCKVGFPVIALEKYIEKLDKIKYSYVIYAYNSKEKSLQEIIRKVGKQHKETAKNINCLLCGKIEKYKEDEYLQAFYKMIESQKEDEK